MFWLICVICIVATQAAVLEKPHLHAFTDELIRYVNEESGASWKAAPSKRFNNLQQAKSLLGTWFETKEQRQSRRPTIRYVESNDDLPKSFDARTQWPDCPSISEIRDQSSCGSCWAFGAVEAMTDRRCIHSKGEFKEDVSARDLMSCCSYCGYGCHGGFPSLAWDFWKNEGIVTGGSLENRTGCQPYPFPKCNHRTQRPELPPCRKPLYPTPKCETRCQAGYNETYYMDKTFGKSSYNLPLNSAQIMREIMTNGPVEGAFDVYEDFLHYHSGIYHHVVGKNVGGHAIRILGWGEENNIPYWLCANSWNEYWGESGYFRIRRGVNECSIESEVTAGMPRV